MKFIQKEPNPSGAYPPIQEKSSSYLPEGYAELNPSCETDVFYQYNGFVTLVLDASESAVMEFVPNVEAWEAWKASLPEPEPEPDPEPDPTILMQAQIAALSDRQDFLEDCIVEMAMEVYE